MEEKKQMQWEEFTETFPIQLNEQQQTAVQSVDGPVLLLAVPGSGKTTVLVGRLGYMILCKGIDPKKILTVTYTVAATKDMSRRFASYFGEDLAEQIEFRTINGICAKIIQYYGKQLGKAPFELVKDEKMTAGMLSRIYQESEQSFATESDLKNVRTLITYIKNMMLTEEEIQKLDEEAEMKISVIYKEYCRQLKEQHLMDYDDQMVYAYTMLRTVPELREHFQKMYPYICVDEAQDTSKIQHAIIALLASKTENLFMVGDEDQSIYGFRAAYPEALLEFEKHHPEAKVLLMEDNFRSNANIVQAADQFIQKNTLRHKKQMRPTREPAAQIREISLKSRRAQYSYLVKVAEKCDTQTAVLYRDNECVLPLVNLLEKKGIPYQMRNAELSFFTHRTVLDVENIVRFAMDPKDTERFLQIYYKIGTYLKRQEVLEIVRISRGENVSILDAAIRYNKLDEHVLERLKTIMLQLQMMLREPGDKAINRIAQHLGYQEYLNRMGIKGSKLEILKILGAGENTPEDLLSRLIELKTLIQKHEFDRNCPFILSTIHASKGLEYDNVYLLDVADGILPESVPVNPKSAPEEEKKAYEEERRLFYVGMTRAKDHLMYFTTNRPSTFCDEISGKNEKKPEKPMESVYEHNRRIAKAKPYAAVTAKAQDPAKGKQYETLIEQLGEGVLVEHKKFGEGVVTALEERRVQILFGETQKTFDLRILAGSGLLKLKS